MDIWESRKKEKRLETFCLSHIFFPTLRNTNIFKLKSFELTLKCITIIISHKYQSSFYWIFWDTFHLIKITSKIWRADIFLVLKKPLLNLVKSNFVINSQDYQIHFFRADFCFEPELKSFPSDERWFKMTKKKVNRNFQFTHQP